MLDDIAITIRRAFKLLFGVVFRRPNNVTRYWDEFEANGGMHALKLTCPKCKRVRYVRPFSDNNGARCKRCDVRCECDYV